MKSAPRRAEGWATRERAAVGHSHSSATGRRKGSSQNPKFLMAFHVETNLSLLSKARGSEGKRREIPEIAGPSRGSNISISIMNSNDPEERRREEFLARAREAEARAARTTDAMLRESWLKVAQGYHDLARKK